MVSTGLLHPVYAAPLRFLGRLLVNFIGLLVSITNCPAAAGRVPTPMQSTTEPYQIILHNEDPVFSTNSTSWTLDKTGDFLEYYRFSAARGDGSARAIWTVDGLPVGDYLLEFFIDDGDYAEAPEFIVEYSSQSKGSGTNSFKCPQRHVTAGWHPIANPAVRDPKRMMGEYPFRGAARIIQSNYWTGAGSKVIADAIRLTLRGKPQRPTVDITTPSITIVVDDLGRYDPDDPETPTGKLFAQAPPQFTYAVIPAMPRYKQVLESAHKRGLETILHQPMEFHDERSWGRMSSATTELKIHMSDDEVRSTIRRCLDMEAPYVVGVNNHTGSLFSEYKRGLEIVMEELRERGLFYYDSRTISDSLGYDVARAAGLLTAERDAFVDSKTTEGTVNYFRSLALRATYAPNNSYLVISHQGEETIDGLLAAVPELKAKGIELRPLSRNVSYIVETDFEPAGSLYDHAALSWKKTPDDMINQECRDGDAYELKCPSARARFDARLPKSGAYQVFVGFTYGAKNCDRVRVMVNGADGPKEFRLNQQVEPDRWHYIGTHRFSNNTTSSVTLDGTLCKTEDHIIKSDCVKFLYDGP